MKQPIQRQLLLVQYKQQANPFFLFTNIYSNTLVPGTQFPPPSSLLYGKMGSITLFFFSNGNIKYDTTFYA